MRNLEDFLADRPVVLSSELRAAGYYQSLITEAVRSGTLLSHGAGLLSTPEAYDDARFQDAAIALVTDGVVGRRTAGMRHGLTTDMPPQVEVLVPHGVTRRATTLPLVLLRSRLPESLTVGVETEEVLGVQFRMTGRARTVVDLWRGSRAAHRAVPGQHPQEALHTYLEDGDATELIELARAFGPAVTQRLEIAVDTFLNAPSRSF